MAVKNGISVVMQTARKTLSGTKNGKLKKMPSMQENSANPSSTSFGLRMFKKREDMSRSAASKYHARKVRTADGVFDSQKEYRRWCELKLLQKAGHITDLERQVRYELVPSQRGEDGKVVEKSVNYIADFRYRENGNLVVEDTKGVRTADYIIKRKLMLFRHGIRIKEI